MEKHTYKMTYLSGRTARVYQLENGDVFLTSYGLSVAAIVNGVPYLSKDARYSCTTRRHVQKFLYKYMEGSIPYVTIPKIDRTFNRDVDRKYGFYFWNDWYTAIKER